MSDTLGEKAYLQSKANTDKIITITNNYQIKGFAVKTQAEYDALSDADKNNGIAYLIKE
jgi:hypothetical protein